MLLIVKLRTINLSTHVPYIRTAIHWLRKPAEIGLGAASGRLARRRMKGSKARRDTAALGWRAAKPTAVWFEQHPCAGGTP
jgi:hypothetical protein